MENLINLEKKINSELTTKINSSRVKHNQIYLSIDSNDIIDVILFMKTNGFPIEASTIRKQSTSLKEIAHFLKETPQQDIKHFFKENH